MYQNAVIVSNCYELILNARVIVVLINNVKLVVLCYSKLFNWVVNAFYNGRKIDSGSGLKSEAKLLLNKSAYCCV